MLSTIDDFLRIFRFYRNNPLTTVREKFKENSILYEDSVDVFINSINWSTSEYPSDTTLTYPEDETVVQTALNAREDLSVLFDNVLFPGSYAFVTRDNSMFRDLLLDWASAIKTIQDSAQRVTNAYSLTSEDTDKAIRGFGVDFINAYSVPSLSRRQTFLLSMCELYKIKGTPSSIVQALDIVGMKNVYIREAWIVPNRNGREDIEIEWRQVKQSQTFNNINNSYDDPYTAENTYMDWNWFDEKIHVFIGEPHWFYTKEEIVNLNWAKYKWDETSSGETLVKVEDAWMKLPSITPYFSIEFYTDADKQNIAFSALAKSLNEQYHQYLNGEFNSIPKNLSYGSYPNRISALQCYCALIYSFIQLDNYSRYNSLRIYLEDMDIKTPTDFSILDNRYLELIYWLYLQRKNSKTNREYNLYNSAINNYVQLKDNGYCSYDEVLYWWLTKEYGSDEDIQKNPLFKTIIQPTGGQIVQDSNDHCQLFWEEKYSYGYYDVEVYSKFAGWQTLYSNLRVNSKYMQLIVPLDNDGAYADSSDISNFRIVHYRTDSNIPDIFFGNPFYFDSVAKSTDMNRIQFYNYIDSTPEYYNNNILKLIFQRESIIPTQDNTQSEEDLNTLKTEVEYNLYKTLYESKVRLTDADNQYRSYQSGLFNYPQGILKEDKDIQIASSLFEYVSWVADNYTDTITHDGSNIWNYHMNKKWPINKRWNWAASGNVIDSDDKNVGYYLWNYESCKWCRCKAKITNIMTTPEESDYGVPWYNGKSIRIKVSDSKEMIIDSDTTYIQDDWNSLRWIEKSESFENESDRDKRVEFLENLNIHCTKYEEFDEDNEIVSYNLKFLLPPSDLYSTNALKTYSFSGLDYSSPFCDTVFKPDSVLARQMVTDSIPIDKAQKIYEDVAAIKSSGDKSVSDELNSQRIDIIHDPFYLKDSIQYTYNDLLNYIYVNRLTIDISNGYLYRPFDFYMDQYGFMYIRCRVREVGGDINTKWVRFKIEMSWDRTEKRDSIYNENSTLGPILPSLGFLKRHDSERLLDGPVYQSTELYTAEEAFQRELDSGNVPGHVNLVLLLDKNNGVDTKFFKIKVKRNKLVFNEEKSDYEIIDEWIDEDKLTDENGNIIENLPSRIFDVNFGICEDILDYINSLYETDVENYVEVPQNLMQTLTDYLQQELGWQDVNLDFNISYLTSNKVVRQIIKFYKPKRARLLYLSMNIEGSVFNDVYSGISVGDSNYNHNDLNNWLWNMPRYNTHERKKNNVTRITQQVNEYVPIDDLHYAGNNALYGEIWNGREFYENNESAPSIECYDRISRLEDSVITLRDQNITASFYTNYYDTEDVEGFYFRIPGSKEDSQFNTYTYTNNNFYFIRSRFQYRTTELKVLNRWFVYSVYANTQDLSSCLYISEEDISDVPWKNSSGGEIKYIKYNSSWTNRQLDENISNPLNYEYGIFQTGNEIKINYRKLEPSVYFNCFLDNRFNGWYYYDYIKQPTKNGQPVYFNQYGKIISFLDYSYISDSYIEPLVNEYYKEYSNIPINRFWVISDNKEIVDFSDASYIAYETYGTPSLFDNDSDGNLTGLTKKFYKLNPKIVGYNNEPELLSEYYGYHISAIRDDFGLVHKKDKDHYRLSDPMSFVNILMKRTPINTVPVRFEPISYINFNYNSFMDDYYFSQDYNVLTDEYDIHKTRVTCSNDINDRSSFVMNEIGYNLGAFYLKDGYITFDSSERVRINRVSDNKKYFTTFVRFKLVNKNNSSFENSTIAFINYGFEINKWYSLSINQSCEKNSSNQWFFSREIFINGKLIETQEAFELLSIFTFSNVDLYISEYAVFGSSEEKLPDWYQPIIHKYRTVRERPEPNKSFDVIGPKNWRPIFAIYEPRTIFGRWCTGIPEILQGDRVRSLKYNQEKKQWEFYPYSSTTSIDGGDLTDRDEYGDPWNVDSYYNPSWPQDFNELWLKKHQNTIYDRQINFRTRKMNYNNGKSGDVIIGFSVNRRDYSDLLEKDSCTLYPYRDSINFNPGLQYSVPSNYVSGFNIPCWWVREPEKYRTGAIHHRPVYIAIQERKEDPWPDIPINEDCGDYYDSRLVFDGKSNIDNSLYIPEKGFSDDGACWWYNENLFDNNTKYSITYQQNLLDKKKCFVINEYGLESEIDCPEEDDESLSELSLSWEDESLSEEEQEIIEKIVKITKDGYEAPQYKGIEDIRNNADTYCKICNGNINYIQDLDQLDLTQDELKCGYYHKTIYCNSFGSDFRYLNGIWKLRNKVESKQNGDFNYCYYHEDSNSELVSTYHLNSGYYWWEIRTCIDGQWVKLLRTFVKPKINLSTSMYEYDYINELQLDICGQKLCSFNVDENGHIQDYDQFANLPYPNIPQKIINENGFLCNKWINLDIKRSSNFNIPGVIDNFVTLDKLYLYHNNEWWYIDCEIDWNDDKIITPSTKDSTSSGFAYRNGYLYIYVHSDESEKYDYYKDDKRIVKESKIYKASENNRLYWIRIKTADVDNNFVCKCVYPWTIVNKKTNLPETNDIVLASDIKSNVDPFGGLGETFIGWAKSTSLAYILKTLIQIPVENSEDTGFYMSVLDASDADKFENTYICTDTIDIRGSIYKLLKYNNKPPYYNQEGKEWVYQKQPDQIVGLRKETFKDYVDIYMYYNCAVDVRCFDPEYVGVECSGDTSKCNVLNYKEEWFVMMETPWKEIRFMSTWRRPEFPTSFGDLYNCYVPTSPVIQSDGSVVYKSWRIIYNPFNEDYKYDPNQEEKYVFKVDVLAEQYWKSTYHPPCPNCFPPESESFESFESDYSYSESESESYPSESFDADSDSESYLESYSYSESELSILSDESYSESISGGIIGHDSDSESDSESDSIHGDSWSESLSESESESWSESESESLSESESVGTGENESENESVGTGENESENESVGTGENESVGTGENESVGTGESESESDAGFESSETIDPRYPYIQTGHELVFNFATNSYNLFANLSGSADCVNFESSDNGRPCIVIFSDVVLNCSGGKNISCDLVLSTGEDDLYISNNRYHLNSGHTHWVYYVYEKYTNTPISINDISDAESITAKYGFKYIEPQFVQSITIPINNMFANMSKPIGEIQDIPGTIIINDKDGDPIRDNETITNDKIDTIELDTNDIDFPNFGHQNKGKFVDMVIEDIIINGTTLSGYYGAETGEYEIGHDGELIMDESYQSSVLLLVSSHYIESTMGIKLADLFKGGHNSIVIKYRFYIVNEHGWNGEQVALPSYEYVFDKEISEIIRDKLNYMFITNSGESRVGFSIYDGRTGDRSMSIMWPHYDSSGQFTGSGEYKIYADDINVGTFNSISSSIFSIRGNEENNIVDTINNLGKFNWISDTVPLNHEMKMVLSNGQSIVFGRSEENIRNGIYSEIDESKLTVPRITQTAEIGDIYLNGTQSTKFVISGNYTDITSDDYPLYIINQEYRQYAALNVFAASLITNTEDKQIESFVNVYKNDFDYTTGEFDVGSNITKYIGKNGCIGIYCTDYQLSYNLEASCVRLYYVAKSGDKESKINTIDIPLIFDFNGEVTDILNSNDISIKDISLLNPAGSGEIDLLLNNKILNEINNIKTITGGINTVESEVLWRSVSFRISGENRLISSISVVNYDSGELIYPEDSSIPSKLYIDQIMLNDDRVFKCYDINKDINIGIKILDVNLWQDLYNGQTFGTGEIKVKIEGIDTSNSFILSGELYRYSGDEKISVGVDSIVYNGNINNNEATCYLPVPPFDYLPDTEYYLHLNSICFNYSSNVVAKMNSTFKFIPHTNNESRIRLQSSNIDATGEAILEMLDPNYYYYLWSENNISISCDLYNSSNVKLHTIDNDMITISKKSKNEISLYFGLDSYAEEIYSDNCYLLLSSIKNYNIELLHDSIKIQLNT